MCTTDPPESIRTRDAFASFVASSARAAAERRELDRSGGVTEPAGRRCRGSRRAVRASPSIGGVPPRRRERKQGSLCGLHFRSRNQRQYWHQRRVSKRSQPHATSRAVVSHNDLFYLFGWFGCFVPRTWRYVPGSLVDGRGSFSLCRRSSGKNDVLAAFVPSQGLVHTTNQGFESGGGGLIVFLCLICVA